jgi:ABC-type glycerol-3-phosphate transport system substrate-binding protein
MRHPLKIALAVLIAAVLAGGCGSDDDSPSGGDAADKTKTSAQAATSEAKSGAEDAPEADTTSGGAKPKKASARSKMVTCLEEAGFDVTHKDQDEEKATNYTVEGSSGRPSKAEIVIHSNQGDAAGAARKAGEEKGLNAVAFGRAEFIRRESTDTEAGQIVNCVAAGYTR